MREIIRKVKDQEAFSDCKRFRLFHLEVNLNKLWYLKNIFRWNDNSNKKEGRSCKVSLATASPGSVLCYQRHNYLFESLFSICFLFFVIDWGFKIKTRERKAHQIRAYCLIQSKLKVLDLQQDYQCYLTTSYPSSRHNATLLYYWACRKTNADSVSETTHSFLFTVVYTGSWLQGMTFLFTDKMKSRFRTLTCGGLTYVIALQIKYAPDRHVCWCTMKSLTFDWVSHWCSQSCLPSRMHPWRTMGNVAYWGASVVHDLLECIMGCNECMM